MADGRVFPRATTVCLLAILVLPEVGGIRTGDHIATIRNLFELLNDQGLTSFLDLVIKAEIKDTFTGKEEMTVFAFNNTAFNMLPNERKTVIREKNRKETEDYVKFHTVYRQRILAENIQDNQKLKSNGPNQNILFTNKKRVQVGIDYDKTEQLFINGARIIKRNIYASNGILHIIDRALEITSNKMAVPYLKEPDDPRVKAMQFYNLIERSLARDELNNEDKITFFVPTDEAMSRVNQEKLDQQKQNQQGLKEIILKHRVSNQVIFTSTVEFGTQWVSNRNIPILNKNSYDQVSVTSGGTTALIVLGNITVGNGVIHMINNLLGFTYNNVREQIESDPQLSEFHSLLEKVYVRQIEHAIGTKNKVTVFAPTNEAFARIKIDKGKLVYDTRFIEKIIKYHIVEDTAWSIAPITVEYNARERQPCMRGSFLSVYNFQYDRYVQGGYVTAKIVRVDVGCTNGIVQYIDKILGLPDEDIMSIIHGHSWLEKLPSKAYEVTGLSDSLAGKTVADNMYSYNLCPGNTCFYTVFVPNETAYQEMRLNTQSQGLLKDTNIHRYLLKRLIFKDRKIYEQSLTIGQQIFEAVNGNKVLLVKDYNNKMYLRYRGKVATVLQSDLGATNGVVHIVDKMLWAADDTTSGYSNYARFTALTFINFISISIFVLLCQ